MTISNNVKKLVEYILTSALTPDQYMELSKKIEVWWKDFSEEEQRYFAESGAGEMLYILISGTHPEQNGKR